MHRRIHALFFLWFFVFSIHAQISFNVEGKNVTTDTLIKTYRMQFQLQDSVKIEFVDSTYRYFGHKGTVIKTVEYPKGNSRITTKIQYLNTDLKDSMKKVFHHDKLVELYEKKYDNNDSLVLDKLTSYWHGTYNFRREYEYVSIANRVTKLFYSTDERGVRKFMSKCIYEFDSVGRKIKETQYTSPNDAFPIVTSFTYNENGEIISMEGNVARDVGPIIIGPAPLISEITMDINVISYAQSYALIKALIFQNKDIFESRKNETVKFIYYSSDHNSKIQIIQNIPYWAVGGRMVVFRQVLHPN